MHVLITRPEPDAGELKSELEVLGHTVSVEPMLRIELLPIPGDAFAGAQAILATSRNAVRALAASAALSPALELPIFTVGAGTAELARASGFRHVIAGAGAARDLVALVEAEADRAKGPLVHVAGEHLAFDLAAAIAGRGYEVRNLTAYRAVAARALTGQTAQRIASGGVDAVLLMSPRTAAIFAQLVGSRGQGRRQPAHIRVPLRACGRGDRGACAPSPGDRGGAKFGGHARGDRPGGNAIHRGVVCRQNEMVGLY